MPEAGDTEGTRCPISGFYFTSALGFQLPGWATRSPPLVLPAGGPGIRQRGLWGTLRRGPGGCPGCGGILPGPEGGGTNGAWPGQEGVAALSLEIRVCKQRALISSGCITN